MIVLMVYEHLLDGGYLVLQEPSSSSSDSSIHQVFSAMFFSPIKVCYLSAC